MKCDFCPQRLQPQWKFCPACGREVVIREEDRLTSMGVSYCPEAFQQESYLYGREIAENDEFYVVFMRYVQATIADPKQLVHFRAHIVHELSGLVGKEHAPSSPHIRWCALSLASDRYFAEKARAYDWSIEEEESIKKGWLDMIAPAFIAGDTPHKLEKKILTAWIERFLALHKRDTGPLPSCFLCDSKCYFQCEVSHITQNPVVRSDFQSSINKQDAQTFESVTRYCRLQSERLIGETNKDFAFCLAIHLIKATEVPPPAVTMLSTDAQMALAHKVRGALDEIVAGGADASYQKDQGIRAQVLEVVIRQALAGAPWKEICSGPMRTNNITVEEVEEAVKRRKESSGKA